GYRIILPWAEPKLVGVLEPGVGQAILRDHGSKIWICQHVYPGSWGPMPRRSRDNILVPVRCKSAQPVEKNQIVALIDAARRLRLIISTGHQRWHPHFPETGASNLFCERAPVVLDNRPGNRLKEDAILG